MKSLTFLLKYYHIALKPSRAWWWFQVLRCRSSDQKWMHLSQKKRPLSWLSWCFICLRLGAGLMIQKTWFIGLSIPCSKNISWSIQTIYNRPFVKDMWLVQKCELRRSKYTEGDFTSAQFDLPSVTETDIKELLCACEEEGGGGDYENEQQWKYVHWQ